MNLPNALTCSRFVLSLIFAGLLFSERDWAYAPALAVFLLATLTDYLDGRLAREKGEITGFGKLMDPIADKTLTLSAFFGFAWIGVVPGWMVGAIVARDILITLFRLRMPKEGPSSEARQSGKQKTVLQFAAITGILIFLIARSTPYWRPEWTPSALSFIWGSMFFVVAVTLWTGLRFALKNRR